MGAGMVWAWTYSGCVRSVILTVGVIGVIGALVSWDADDELSDRDNDEP
jgi:hypothetical protein